MSRSSRAAGATASATSGRRMCEIGFEGFTRWPHCDRPAAVRVYFVPPYPPGWDRWFDACVPCCREGARSIVKVGPLQERAG